MSIERARQEIDDGIASVKAALGDDKAVAPFFRIPGLLRAEAVERYLGSQGIQTWSADFPADDWRHIPASRVYDLAIRRIEAKGKGILLLHDIQPRTVAALPRILQELKARGYRIVHVVPATPELAATPTEPRQWQLHPAAENVATSHWPKIRNFVFTQTEMLPAPSLSDLDWRDAESVALVEPPDAARRHLRSVPLSEQTLWPQPLSLALASATIALPVPAQSIFEIEENPNATAQSLLPLLTSRPASRPDGAPTRRRLKADRSQRRHDPGQAKFRSRPEARRVQICRPRQQQRSRCPSGPAETCGAGQEAKKRVTPQRDFCSDWIGTEAPLLPEQPFAARRLSRSRSLTRIAARSKREKTDRCRTSSRRRDAASRPQ